MPISIESLPTIGGHLPIVQKIVIKTKAIK